MFPLYLAIAVFSPGILIMMMLTPGGVKKRRTHRRSSPNQAQAPTGVNGILALIDHASSPFETAVLDELWPNNRTGQNLTWRQRIEEAVEYWVDNVQNSRPSSRITAHDYLKKKNSFGRTEGAFKCGMLSTIVYICVYGSKATFSKDTNCGGLLKMLEGRTEYNQIILPLVTHIVRYYNCIGNKDEALLTIHEVLDENFGNWRKNMIRRSKDHGVYSNRAVLAMIRGADNEDDSNPPYDDSACKGLYYPWYLLISIHHKNFHQETMKANPSHYLVEAEGTQAAWDAALLAPAFA